MAKFHGLLCLASGRPRNDGQGHPQLHLNLWEQVDRVSLDIGLLIRRDFGSDELYFYLPWPKAEEALIDLTARINDPDAIAAVFNESWEVTRLPRSSSATVKDPNRGTVLFQVISPANYWSIDDETPQSHRIKLDFGRLVKTEPIQAQEIYLRFRIKGVPREFYAVGFAQGDQGLVSSWTKNEFIDFRLNVRRGAPPDLETHVGHYVSFSKIHLFLMRHRSNELVFQDTAFRSCRSLEDEHFWAKYSHDDEHPSREQLEDARSHVVNSLGYQWTKRTLEGAPAHEFGILARFKRIELSIPKFLFYAVLISGTGSAAWSLVSWLFVTLVTRTP